MVFRFVAIGPRPLLKIPDEITLPETVIKTTSEKKVWIKNIGRCCARFSMYSENPFEIEPKKATLAPDEIMTFDLYFKPDHWGVFDSELFICYESGERLCVRLKGRASEASVFLEQTRLRFKDTYEMLSDQRSVKLYNNSDYIVQYYWKMHPSLAVEKQHRDELKRKWKEMKDYESFRGNKLKVFDVIDCEGHAKVYDRIYNDEVEEFETNDQFLYQHKAFKIEPMVRSFLIHFFFLIEFTLFRMENYIHIHKQVLRYFLILKLVNSIKVQPILKLLEKKNVYN